MALSLLLTACGGGGGDSNSVPASTTPALRMFAGTWGPSASVDGIGTAANFYSIGDMAFDASGNLLVVDGVGLRKVTPAAEVTTLAAGGFATIAVDSGGQMFGGDYTIHICRLGFCAFGSNLYRLTAAGTVAERIGIKSAGSLVASNGDLFFTDEYSSVIRRLAATGEMTIVAGIENSPGSDDGPATSARFGLPVGLAIDANRNLYVTDSLYHDIRKIAPDGTVTTIAGVAGVAGSLDGPGASARFNNPWGIAVDGAGNLYVADAVDCTVRKVDSQRMVTTVAGNVGACTQFVGGALPGALHWPVRVAVHDNDLYIGMRNGIAVMRVRP